MGCQLSDIAPKEEVSTAGRGWGTQQHTPEGFEAGGAARGSEGCCAHIRECKRKISDETPERNLTGTVPGVGNSLHKLLEVQLLRRAEIGRTKGTAAKDKCCVL